MKYTIDEKDLQDLLKAVKSNIKAIEEGRFENALFSLEVLESHLENNLLKEDKEVA